MLPASRLRKIMISISPFLTEKAGRFYVYFILPLLPVDACAVQKYIGEFGPFRFHPRFMFRDFSNWGITTNIDFKASVEACKGKKCIIDIGAHIGLVSLPMSRSAAPDGKVYSFEPADPDRFYFSENVRLSGIKNIEIADCLVGKTCKEGVLFYQQKDESGVSSVVIMNKHPERYMKSYKRQISIDAFCKEKGISPEIIKIDAEGNELDILEGATDTLKNCKPVIFMSMHGGHIGELGRDAKEIYGILEQAAYEIVNIDGSPVDNLLNIEYILRPLKSA